MKKLLMTTMALGFVLTFNNHEVTATTLSPKIDTNSNDNIVLVRGGCGWGHHRNFNGFCVPNWGNGWHRWHYWRGW